MFIPNKQEKPFHSGACILIKQTASDMVAYIVVLISSDELSFPDYFLLQLNLSPRDPDSISLFAHMFLVRGLSIPFLFNSNISPCISAARLLPLPPISFGRKRIYISSSCFFTEL